MELYKRNLSVVKWNKNLKRTIHTRQCAIQENLGYLKLGKNVQTLFKVDLINECVCRQSW